MADEAAAAPSPAATPKEEKPPAEEPGATKEGEGGTGESLEKKSEEQTRKGPPKKGKCASCLTFLYNPVNKTVLGRTGLSWLKIFIFYIIFLIAVFAFFCMLIVIFYQFVKTDEPYLTGNHSLLQGKPGLGFRPLPDKKKLKDSSLIWFKQGEKDSYIKYIEQLTQIVKLEDKDYPTEYKKTLVSNCNMRKGPGETEICKAYDKDNLDWGECTEAEDFGYKHGRPCILIRINRIIGWEPETNTDAALKYHEKVMETKIQYDFNTFNRTVLPDKAMAQEFIWLDCLGEKTIDRRMTGPIMYYPKIKSTAAAGAVRPQMTIPNTFYPYKNQLGYLTPFVMIQLPNPTYGALLQIRCQAYDQNIEINAKEGLGSVRFEVMVDPPTP